MSLVSIKKNIFKDYLLVLLALVFVGFCLFPIYIMITTSFKSEKDIFAWEHVWFFKPTIQSVYNAFFIFGGKSVASFILNSLITTFTSTFLAVLFGAMAAYGFSRYKFKGSKHIAFYILSTRFAPPVAFIIPIYLMVNFFNLLDTHFTLIIIYTSMNLSLSIWILRGYFNEIPIEIEEAAYIDGYTRVEIFWKVCIPLIKPGLITTAILCSIFSWNEFLFAVILTQRDASTIPVYLASFQDSMGLAWGEFMAVGAMAVMPILIFTIILQKHLVRGLTFGAIR